MANKDVFLQGKVKWVHTKRLNKFGKWTATLYPTPESLTIIRELIEEGIKNNLKKDDDGYYIAFSRPPEKMDKQGRRFPLSPVEIIDSDGRAFDGWIGNGSDCTLKIETYGGKSPIGTQYKAARLAGIKVENLVPYEPDSMSTDERAADTAAQLKTQPPMTGWA